MNKKPIVKYNPSGESGNIFYILGQASITLRKEHRQTDFNELRDKVFDCKSYESALNEIRQYVELIEIKENEE